MPASKRDRALLVYLGLWVLILTLPWINQRLIRTAGDEKVYIAQALEMQEAGLWFKQLLHRVPDYYKGPLHYILIRIGLAIWGPCLAAALYMNVLFLTLGAWASFALLRDIDPERPERAFFGGMSFVAGAGILGHAFASQMEVELAGFYAFGAYALYRTPMRVVSSACRLNRWECLWWISSGLAGTAKSPLHSVLLGLSGAIYWALRGDLRVRLQNLQSWMMVGLGVVLCGLSYLPAVLGDPDAFLQHYFYRETLKHANGGYWWQANLALTTYYLIPFLLPSLLAYGCLVRNGIAQWRLGFWMDPWVSASQRVLLRISLAILAPTVLFFSLYPYRGEYYALPAVIGIITWVAAGLGGLTIHPSRWVRGVLMLGLPGALLLPLLALLVRLRIPDTAELFGIPLLLTLGFLGVVSVIRQYQDLRLGHPHPPIFGVRSAVGRALVALQVLSLLTVFGEHELGSLKESLKKWNCAESGSLTYWNLDHHLWSEWGLMTLCLHQPIRALLNEEDLQAAIRQGKVILTRNQAAVDSIHRTAQTIPEKKTCEAAVWLRYRTHARDAQGHSVWGAIWRERSLAPLYLPTWVILYRMDPATQESVSAQPERSPV